MWLFKKKTGLQIPKWMDDLRVSLLETPELWSTVRNPCPNNHTQSSIVHLVSKSLIHWYHFDVFYFNGAEIGSNWAYSKEHFFERKEFRNMVLQHLAIRSKFAARIDFDATAKAMANAVLAGETTAAYGLADHIIENCKREENI